MNLIIVSYYCFLAQFCIDLNFYEDVGTKLANEGLKGDPTGTDHGEIGPEMDKKLNEIEAKTEEVEEEKKEVMSVVKDFLPLLVQMTFR